MDARQMLDEVGKMEQTKTRVEERIKNNEKEKDKLASRMAELGVTPASIDSEINKLRTRLERTLAEAKGISSGKSEESAESILGE